MRRLRRARQREARQRAKHGKRFKMYAVTAGTAAAITLGTAAGLNKALADGHQLPVSKDADADLLANKEELAIGYRVFRGDQNRNQIRDGVELAKRCAADINDLPIYSGGPEPNETYKIILEYRGLEECEICSAWLNMGGVQIINPKLGLRYPSANDPLDAELLPFLAVHYMEHGSFDCFAESGHTGRVDVDRLLRVLELRFPYEPNEHQLPLDYVVAGVGQLASDVNDHDGDLMADSEELAAGYNLYNPDQDGDLEPDGIELAKQCAQVIESLPIEGVDPIGEGQVYKQSWFQLGLELCEICGAAVNMGGWLILNPKLGLYIFVQDIKCHYMSHGSFSYSGQYIEEPHEPFHTGRIDIALLAKILEIPGECGHLGTMYLPGDSNEDCEVNFADVAEAAEEWLESTDPNDSNSIEY